MYSHITKIVSLFLVLAIVFYVSANQPEELVIVNEFSGQVDFMQGRVIQLFNAMPEETYGWRPSEGVRSVSEVYLHIAFANYLCVTLSGGKVPDDAGFVMDFAKAKEWDTQSTNKAEIMAKMEKSFGVLKERIKNLTADDLNKEIEFFDTKMSIRNFIISMIAHCHEHLGQSIAYARSNNVVPPWSIQLTQE